MNNQKRGHNVSGGLIQKSLEEGNSERNDLHFFQRNGEIFSICYVFD
jgi:hypothetical protein